MELQYGTYYLFVCGYGTVPVPVQYGITQIGKFFVCLPYLR